MALTRITFNLIKDSYANVKDYGASGVDNAAVDDTAAFTAAIATLKPVYVPKGNYRCNATLDRQIIVVGDGSSDTKIYPFNDAVAAFTYRGVNVWTYNSEIRGIGFWGNSSRVGVGFTFARTVIADFVAGDQLIGNVTFFGCDFHGLEKGVQMPYGNIGNDFYSCSFKSCYYGVYTLDNKFSAAIMPPSVQHFYSGEFSSNYVCYYINNVTSGFGDVAFTNTIFESNYIVAYVYSTGTFISTMKFDNCWNEQNGFVGHPSSTILIDQWSGTVNTPANVDSRSFIFQGSGLSIEFANGFFTDTILSASYSQLLVNKCFCAVQIGNNGALSYVENSSSQMILRNCHGEFPTGTNITVEQPFVQNQIGVSATNTWWNPPIRGSKTPTFGVSTAASAGAIETFANSVTISGGAISLVGTVVADGRIFNTCNEYTRSSFLTTDFLQVSTTQVTTPAVGYYVFTFDAKVTVGAPKFNVWNASIYQMATGMNCPSLNNWYSFACISYCVNSGINFYLDVQGNNADCTWRMSAFQIHYFTSYQKAREFLDSGVFATISGFGTLDNTGTPSVLAYDNFLTGGTTTITDFDDGITGQVIRIVAEHGLVITDGTNIFLAGSANFTMAATDTLTLICKADNKWYELARSDN